MTDTLSKAVFTVLEGFTLPHDARKILETAYYAQPVQQEPIVCTKTWFDGEKVITKNLTVSDVYAPPVPT
jgi:hypothetical protein